MLKKVLIIIILLNSLLNCVVPALGIAEEDSYNDTIITIVPYSADDEANEISREECLIAIMKLIGIDEETAYNTAKYTWFDDPCLVMYTLRWIFPEA